jgi:hypothetical protein
MTFAGENSQQPLIESFSIKHNKGFYEDGALRWKSQIYAATYSDMPVYIGRREIFDKEGQKLSHVDIIRIGEISVYEMIWDNDEAIVSYYPSEFAYIRARALAPNGIVSPENLLYELVWRESGDILAVIQMSGSGPKPLHHSEDKNGTSHDSAK